ncbi:MFS transporter [Epidermidibacterium keratini]|uniref:Putative proline/betaine transporter n=1 Tax=Epidermidibacterium keratini TaxID=1891644 RepID=A0A7M3T514_9ACTN|nr:MFS transporter [Epidermidibacterium keratini]QHB98868.1 MFS transporter [Epidermidibacterium keratini]
MSQHTSAPDDRRSAATLRKVTTGATIGAIVEWFDIAVYGYLAVEIGAVFFASDNPTVSLLQSFAVFGLAYVVRPLGGIFFGALADKVGRQKVLAWIILLVSGATFLIGFLPGHASIGVLAPLLLVVLRLIQGFSAGGEMGGASGFVAEYAPVRRRGFYVSWVEFGAIAGFLSGSLLVTILRLSLSEEAMLSWGWRIPFLIAGPLGAVGLYIRNRLEETPEFSRLQESGEVAKNPLGEAITKHWRAILLAGAFALFQNVALYVILTFLPSYISGTQGYSTTTASVASLLTLATVCTLIPIFGALSDRIGRKPLLMASCALGIVLPYPLFLLMSAGPAMAVISAVLLGIMLAIYLGPILVAINELFDTKVRFGGFGIGYNISVALFGGTAPFVVGLLTETTGIKEMAGIYIAISAVLTIIAVAISRESAPNRTGYDVISDKPLDATARG